MRPSSRPRSRAPRPTAPRSRCPSPRLVEPVADEIFVTGVLGEARRRLAASLAVVRRVDGATEIRVAEGDLALSAPGRILLRAAAVETEAELGRDPKRLARLRGIRASRRPSRCAERPAARPSRRASLGRERGATSASPTARATPRSASSAASPPTPHERRRPDHPRRRARRRRRDRLPRHSLRRRRQRRELVPGRAADVTPLAFGSDACALAFALLRDRRLASARYRDVKRAASFGCPRSAQRPPSRISLASPSAGRKQRLRCSIAPAAPTSASRFCAEASSASARATARFRSLSPLQLGASRPRARACAASLSPTFAQRDFEPVGRKSTSACASLAGSGSA